MRPAHIGAAVVALLGVASACSKASFHAEAATSSSNSDGTSSGSGSSGTLATTSAGPTSAASTGGSSSSGTGGGGGVGAGACPPLPMQGQVVTVSGFDEASIVDAIASANAGDTVVFPAGTYAVATTIMLKGGVLYHGAVGAILHANGGSIARASGAAVAGISIDGLTFDGGNLIFSGDTTTFSANVNVVNSTIRNVASTANFGAMQGILVDHLTGSRFDCNTFTDNGVVGQISYALIAYSTNQSSFSHNLLTHTYQGFHFESSDTTGGNDLTVSYNQGDSLLGIGIEFQKNAKNAVIEHNTLGNWRSGNANGMALSIVPSGPNNSIRYNNVSGAGCSTCNIGIEANGTNSFFEDNTIDGFYTNIAISCATGTSFSGNVMNNAGKWGPFDKDGGYCGGEIIGPNTINGVVMTGYSL